MKLFVDTNWFLGLYNGTLAQLTQLSDIEGVRDSLVLNRQSRFEFQRNRRAKIDEIIKAYQEPGFREAPCLRDRASVEDVRSALGDFNQKRERVIQELVRARDDIRADEIGRRFIVLWGNCHDAPINDVIMARSAYRKQRGDPPKSSGTTTGDEIHWESLLAWTTSLGTKAHHLAILTRDNGFLDNEHFLREELLEHAGRDLVVSKDLQEVLAAMRRDTQDNLPDDLPCQNPSCNGGVLRLFPSGKPTTQGIGRLCQRCGQTHGIDIIV